MSEAYLDDEDVQVMLRVRGGDRAAFGELVQRYGEVLIHFVSRYTNHRSVAEDLAQEVFLRAFRSAAGYKPTARFKTWLLTIATNVCINRLRWESKRKHPSLDQPANADETRTFADDLEAEHPGPDAPVEQDEVRARVREAICALPDRQRLALILARYHDLPYAEIGQVMELSVKAVKSLLNRAKENLRERLERELSDYEEYDASARSPGGKKGPR